MDTTKLLETYETILEVEGQSRFGRYCSMCLKPSHNVQRPSVYLELYLRNEGLGGEIKLCALCLEKLDSPPF